ncbi:MAG TPA: hypothetical protein VMS17_15565 [Gemmataceae bacterium]|nr:hypothetical protein [Gemmataceae bacterium]
MFPFMTSVGRFLASRIGLTSAALSATRAAKTVNAPKPKAAPAKTSMERRMSIYEIVALMR